MLGIRDVYIDSFINKADVTTILDILIFYNYTTWLQKLHNKPNSL